ncbi:hypothetical protein SULI_10720 [Saccharolobus solfataricus]|uniref:Uncharacterized protein n=3 Tax=Saccharolobus solfataricus TaxID=2287 RepID=Q97Z20_SACS2|nr:hypothetical protein [Saccharolobus solfataricus]AAK41377.1 Hypothetical protein SSO1121 [Saccharolobus solfataricus P2]AKA74320.1 hypothetical protein SULB_2126 [Saccharolobus solfataricus]AKA77016.1 hypothetical protein SULC_2124 [Saccharolobus solfataricus]AKA79708.1 hypothetical protein SULA_2125 [Saccharolobus solfataricus]AZF68803.1 hypothetical protein SULG_10720 [Saccharolobus solfataricus]
MWINIRVKMGKLEDYLKKKGFSLVNEGKRERVVMDDYEFFIENLTILLPIPLPTGKESLDDLIGMGTRYARASRISQGLGAPLEYELNGTTIYIIKRFQNREDLENSIIKSLEGIESLRYFI